MAYTFDDFINVCGINGSDSSTESFSTETAECPPMSVEELQKIFKNVDFSESSDIIYFPMKLCHSLPSVNQRKRCFTAKTLANSYGTAVDGLLNYEHNMVSNNFAADRIIGHIKSVMFDPYHKAVELADAKTIPPEAIPMYALGALHRKADGVDKLVEQHLTRKRKWGVSMECDHNLRKSALLYRGEFIPSKDAAGDMLECVRVMDIKPYKGEPLSLVLGGVDGEVQFIGAGMTTEPADGDAAILSFVAAQSREAASRSKTFFMPLRARTFSDADGTPDRLVEVASKYVDTRISELASMGVIGETGPGGADAHSHLILSDMSVMPAKGHEHSLEGISVSRGTKPRLTAKTSTHRKDAYDSNTGARHSDSHNHLIDIPLTGKWEGQQPSDPPSTTPDPYETSNPSYDVPAALSGITLEMSSVTFHNSEDAMTLEELIRKLEVSSVKLTGDSQTEVASVVRELKAINTSGKTAEAIEAEIAARIKAGKLMTKEAADTAVTTAVTEEQKKHAAQLNIEKIRNRRLEEVRAAGIDLELEYEGILDSEGKTMTIGKQLSEIPADDAGERSFRMQLIAWMGLQSKINADKAAAEKAAAVAAAPVAEPVVTEVASKAAANKPTASKKGILALVGGGPIETEVASAAHAEQLPANKQLIGKSRFTKFLK